MGSPKIALKQLMENQPIVASRNSGILLIIPFYNEAARISTEEFTKAFTKYGQIDFLLVDDGSSDNTAEILKAFEITFSNVRVLLGESNSGKASSIRRGVLDSGDLKYEYIGYIDADLATPFSEFENLATFATKNKIYDFVMGSRIKKMGSTIQRYQYRHYIGRVFATLISGLILKIPVYDTQCGAKIIKAKLASELFAEPFITKWLFDVELLLRYQKKTPDFHRHIYEFSLNIWTEKGNSKITLSDIFGFPFQLFKIYFNYKCYI